MSTMQRDVLGRIILGGMLCAMTYRIAAASLQSGNLWNLLILISAGLSIGFLVFGNRAKDVSENPVDWMMAVAGTGLPLLIAPGGSPFLPVAIPAAMMLVGPMFELYAKLSLNKSFGIVPANRGVRTKGFYAFVRHPMYASYLVTWIGFLLLNPTGWNLSVYAAATAFQICRILAEERLLNRDPAYQEYAQAVRYRFVPGIF